MAKIFSNQIDLECHFILVLLVKVQKICCTVEPLKTDTPRDKPKHPSYRGVCLIEVSQNFHITVYMTL